MIRSALRFTFVCSMVVIGLAALIYIFGFIGMVALALFPYALAFTGGVLAVILVVAVLAKYGVV